MASRQLQMRLSLGARIDAGNGMGLNKPTTMPGVTRQPNPICLMRDGGHCAPSSDNTVARTVGVETRLGRSVSPSTVLEDLTAAQTGASQAGRIDVPTVPQGLWVVGQEGRKFETGNGPVGFPGRRIASWSEWPKTEPPMGGTRNRDVKGSQTQIEDLPRKAVP